MIELAAQTNEPLGNEAGFCSRCSTNEAGEAISQTRFESYTDAAATDKKILHNVLVKGDGWYRTSDLMRRDAPGYFYFVDRLGDTGCPIVPARCS